MQNNFQGRLEKLKKEVDQLIVKRSRWSSACICFPQSEQPYFIWPTEYETALHVKCPIHGDHFHYREQRYFVFAARWLRINRYLFKFRLSEQYQRAWAATFPYWPTKEEDDEAVYLRFKNGAKYLAQRKADPFTHIHWPDHRVEGPDDLPPEVLYDIS